MNECGFPTCRDFISKTSVKSSCSQGLAPFALIQSTLVTTLGLELGIFGGKPEVLEGAEREPSLGRYTEKAPVGHWPPPAPSSELVVGSSGAERAHELGRSITARFRWKKRAGLLWFGPGLASANEAYPLVRF
jgi:hypothetical protein